MEGKGKPKSYFRIIFMQNIQNRKDFKEVKRKACQRSQKFFISQNIRKMTRRENQLIEGRT